MWQRGQWRGQWVGVAEGCATEGCGHSFAVDGGKQQGVASLASNSSLRLLKNSTSTSPSSTPQGLLGQLQLGSGAGAAIPWRPRPRIMRLAQQPGRPVASRALLFSQHCVSFSLYNANILFCYKPLVQICCCLGAKRASASNGGSGGRRRPGGGASRTHESPAC